MRARLRAHSTLVANLSLLLILAVGVAFLGFGVLRWRPWDDTYRVTVHLADSAGIQKNSDVTLRGFRIGSVESVQVRPDSVDVVVAISGDHRIPSDSPVSVQNLSAAGEQYVDFTPAGTAGPYLHDGSSVAVHQTHTMVSFPTLLAHSTDVIGQIAPDKLRSTIDELNVALADDGPDSDTNRLRTLFDAGGTLFADLYRVMPQTTQLIRNAGEIFATSANIGPDLSTTVDNFDVVMNSAIAADKELRTLLTQSPAELTSVAGSVSAVTDPITDVLKQFQLIARQGAVRAPALASLFPAIVDNSPKLGNMFHDGAWWAVASLYPRPYCDYAVTPTPPTQILAMTVPTNLYCVTDDTRQQNRGSANAPRPPGDDTAGPAPGADPTAHTTPLN
ncbi:MlaD family protein [Gordonia jinhuaensis]|uniref:MlaD family protein n=1 Tax=Gordonia jinhuaensis TaxID=1517702 RepID=UPI00166CAD2D|nr:MlaD family protein [Gordonia jinhuaensis]